MITLQSPKMAMIKLSVPVINPPLLNSYYKQDKRSFLTTSLPFNIPIISTFTESTILINVKRIFSNCGQIAMITHRFLQTHLYDDLIPIRCQGLFS